MTITPLNLGAVANDGNGQDLRSGGVVINANFAELDQRAAAAQDTADGAVIALDGKVDKIPGKGLSTEDFTTGEKNKLAGLQSAHYRGTFLTLGALQAGLATPIPGDYGDVDAGVGEDVQRYIWDATDTKWVLQGASGGGPDNTDSLPEGTTNLYFTGSRVLSVVLSGLSLLTGTAVVATDSVLVAFGKLQKQITDLAATVSNKASKGANSDITAITGLSTPLAVNQGGTGSASGLSDMIGASASVSGVKGLVPAPSAGATRFLSSLGTWLTVSASASWGSITGTLSAQTDLQAALNSGRSIGLGQTWQDMTSQRALGTTYTNSTGRPIQISIYGGPASVANTGYRVAVDGILIFGSYVGAGIYPTTPTVIIPSGSTYQVTPVSGTIPLFSWVELR